ncbi:unnamed protein product [Timema podura]|uniref:Uncharacterized protein n=1 Tax=Timema podura TaxID=61482 RepID=A0ABN7NZ42_TIMPD|nr:unnamed protein product [Timema podura]
MVTPWSTTEPSKCKHLPHSYSHQTNKEKLILWYAENCRRQFHFLHPDRRPQFLAADNECGIQKMVCTTIRPTSVPYPEFSTWQGCAKFVSDHLLYKPLEKPTLLAYNFSVVLCATFVILRTKAEMTSLHDVYHPDDAVLMADSKSGSQNALNRLNVAKGRMDLHNLESTQNVNGLKESSETSVKAEDISGSLSVP